MCTGACLASAAQYWGELGLGPTPHDPPAAAGLAPVALVDPQPLRIPPPLLRLLHVCICI